MPLRKRTKTAKIPLVRKARVVPDTEFSDAFTQAMYDRMCVSYYKYGAVAKAYPKHADAIGSLLVRLMKYCGQERLEKALKDAAARLPKYARGGELEKGDHNTEWTVDAGNFAMIEFMKPSYDGAKFQATDSRESPGRMDKEGRVNLKDNENI